MIDQRNQLPPYPQYLQPQYPNANLPANYLNPGPPLIVAQPNAINKASNDLADKILEKQRVMELENENKRLKDKIDKDRFKALESKIDRNNEMNKEINRTQTELLIAQKNQPILPTNNINIINKIEAEPSKTIIVDRGRLKYSEGMFCVFLCLNIILPGIGTIIAGAMYGKDTSIGPRTGEIICHGVTQLLTCVLIFGWVWAIMDAANYFAQGTCCG